MTITTDDFRAWLERKYHDYDVAAEPVHGTYGLIWFLTTKSPKSSPKGFAVKTLAPEKIISSKSLVDLANLRREFRMWLALPSTYNVVSALGFDIASLVGVDGSEVVNLPVMRMPRMDGSLDDWVNNSKFDGIDKLIALAQALNGLLHLYTNGFEGHGDLKPSNLLYIDMRSKFQLHNCIWPSEKHPWQVCVADLGWADAWVDLGFSGKVFRPYKAPERVEGKFSPIKSDMFSMGVIAAQLLQGHHPAPNIKRAEESDKSWKKWVESGERKLEGISSDRIRTMILRCLNLDPAARPDANECLGEICAELKETYCLDIAQALAAWRKPIFESVAAQNEHQAWAANNSIRLGSSEVIRSLEQITSRLKKIQVHDICSCEEWVPLADSYLKLLEAAGEVQEASKVPIRKLALNYLLSILGKLDRPDVLNIQARDDLPNVVQPFERFSEVVKLMADLADFPQGDELEPVEKLGAYARSALAFGKASALRFEGGRQSEVIALLTTAINVAQDEPVNYYFRARWIHEILFLSPGGASSEKLSSQQSMQTIISDLERAISLASDWEEPKNLLQSIKS
ncbi:MAG: protein kinase family protein [Gallionellaceae bacterium]|nr:MAG: protein kinase family protein [Gallionellaceae bacterium]